MRQIDQETADRMADGRRKVASRMAEQRAATMVAELAELADRLTARNEIVAAARRACQLTIGELELIAGRRPSVVDFHPAPITDPAPFDDVFYRNGDR